MLPICCLLILAALNVSAQQKEFPKLTGPYLGQKPPGTTPELFAPGIVSTGLNELNSVFSPDGGRAVARKWDYRGLFFFAASYYME
ncbi:MAG: hypothetical protein IH584_01170 [Candidatus Aminicenantes bacterium]|nr:hypothetical protein [Candidatus Aminicenantes bacterium]